ncbi:MAG: hypothetical protein HN521_07830 [Candidatus Latescibacteria bacterium]|jgi:hypothetical protein|nr:hypothetical protein [Candidatus Latescibacterota bacterium]
MDLSDFFEIRSLEDSVFHFKLKGLWTDEVSDQIEEQYLQMWKEAVDSMQGERFIVLADTQEFKPPYQRAKLLIAESMKYAVEHNLYKSVEVMPSAIMRLAIQQAADGLHVRPEWVFSS